MTFESFGILYLFFTASLSISNTLNRFVFAMGYISLVFSFGNPAFTAASIYSFDEKTILSYSFVLLASATYALLSTKVGRSFFY